LSMSVRLRGSSCCCCAPTGWRPRRASARTAPEKALNRIDMDELRMGSAPVPPQARGLTTSGAGC